ncbi:MAG: DUF4159 domain-containing protein [Dehalococcoidales bacterium]|nr:MAG: DUF4159 domain-containing protein [Dehalococcoidales bacterium]
MALKDIIKFQLKRVNPFQGLVVDADTWRDAHDYHRDQQRLHLLAFHGTGVVEGLEVSASNPPSLSLDIHGGMAIDPEGNCIIVSQTQHYQVQTRQKGVIYLVIQFREIPSEPFQPPESGQPTRIIEAYRVQERDKLPDEPHLELARIDFDPGTEIINNAKNKKNPGKNEIDLNHRQSTRPLAPEKVTASKETAEKTEVVTVEKPTPPATVITIGHAVLGDAEKDLHLEGLKNLVKEINRQDNVEVSLRENITLDKNASQFSMIYLTGKSSFELDAGQQTALSSFLELGGVILGEGCSEGEGEESLKAAREFGLAFNQLANQLKCKLEAVQRGHPLLSTANIFSDVPAGAQSGMLLEGGRMVYSGSDYGCAWQGGYKDSPLSRDIIRSSLEIGANIVASAKV